MSADTHEQRLPAGAFSPLTRQSRMKLAALLTLIPVSIFFLYVLAVTL